MLKKSITKPKKSKVNFHLLTFLYFCFFNTICTFPLRQLPKLENDQKFLLLTPKAIKEESKPIEKRNYQQKIEEIKNSTSYEDLNDRSVFLIRIAKITEAENILLSLIKKEPEKITSYLNLYRLYYLTDEYDIIRNIFSQFYDRNQKGSEFAEKLLAELVKQNRLEERILLLDTLSSKPGWEIKALEELGIYFYETGNYNNAEIYFEKILSAQSFNQIALYYMALISLEQEKYSDVLLYTSNLTIEKTKKENIYYLIVKANFELGKYKEALKWAEKTPQLQKTDFEFLNTWKNSLLANNIYADLSPVKKYFSVLKKKGLKIEEKSFFLTDEPEGKSLLKNIIHGR